MVHATNYKEGIGFNPWNAPVDVPTCRCPVLENCDLNPTFVCHWVVTKTLEGLGLPLDSNPDTRETLLAIG